MISITPSAAQHLRELLAGQSSPEASGLRLSVEKGGCAGLQYVMKLDSEKTGDSISSEHGVRVFIDSDSTAYLSGCQLDYEDGLNDAGFKIRNPNAARSCGCGTSFEPQASK